MKNKDFWTIAQFCKIKAKQKSEKENGKRTQEDNSPCSLLLYFKINDHLYRNHNSDSRMYLGAEYIFIFLYYVPKLQP